MSMREVIEHYDKLVDENNDPVRDTKPLKDYMDKWDGQRFIEGMRLDKSKSVLEIGVGTGRLALKIAPLCKSFKELFLMRFPEHCSLKAGAKVRTFLIPAKYFKEKFKETIVFYTLVDVNQA